MKTCTFQNSKSVSNFTRKSAFPRFLKKAQESNRSSLVYNERLESCFPSKQKPTFVTRTITQHSVVRQQPAAVATASTPALARRPALPSRCPQMTREIPEVLLNFCILVSSAIKYLSLTSHSGQSDTCQSQEQGQITTRRPTASQQ